MDARPDDDAGADDSAGPDRTPDTPGGPDEERPAPSPDGVPTTSDDDAWASIVARLSDVAAEADPSSSGRVLRPPRDDDATPDEQDAPDGAAVHAPPVPVGRDWDGTSQYDAAEDAVDDLEHFVPPEPGPVLGGDPLLTLAWGATAGVPLFMLVVVVVWRDAPTLLVRVAAVVFVIAVGVLLWRMPQHREPSDDDGAVV